MNELRQHIMRDCVSLRLWLMELRNPHQLPSHEHVTAVESFGETRTACGEEFRVLMGENGKRYMVNVRSRAVKLI